MDNNQPDAQSTVNEQKSETAPSVTPPRVQTSSPGFSIDNKALAIISLILGVVLSPIIGLVLGIVALAKMKKSGDKSGIGFAVASVSIGGLTIAYVILMFIMALRSGMVQQAIEAFGVIFSFLIDLISAFFKEIFNYYFK